MIKPLLSVIIPVYNNEKYMRETIEHVQKATYDNIEIIVVDDGSIDNSANIVLDMKSNDNRIKLISKSNEGVASSRNTGLAAATGEYICFMDQDDVVEPFIYEKLLVKMIDCNCEIGICSSARLIDGEIKPLDVQEDDVYKGQNVAKDLLLPMIYNDFCVPIEYKKVSRQNHIWVCIFHRAFLMNNSILFRAYVDFEDDLLFKTEALSLANCVCTISDIGYYWRIHRKSESHAHRNITDIGSKQDSEYSDLARSLKNIGRLNDEKLNKCIIYCKQYIKAVINSTCSENCKNVKEIKRYFDQNIYSRDFDVSIQYAQYLCTNKLRWKLVFHFLKRKKTILCFVTEKILEWVQRQSLLRVAFERLKDK